MVFRDLVNRVDAEVERRFKDFDPAITIHPSDGGVDFTVEVVQSAPQFQDDFIPGDPTGVGVLLLFIASGTYAALTRKPRKGDTASLNSVDYDIFEVPVDRAGGATMKMRKRNRRFDQ